jgi:Txe/YoeB family toxin of toxin-antitoxin system
LCYTSQAQRDAKKIITSGLKPKVQELLALLTEDPFKNPPSYEKLAGDLSGAYSCRINIRHRLIYEVLEEERLSRSCACGEPLRVKQVTAVMPLLKVGLGRPDG